MVPQDPQANIVHARPTASRGLDLLDRTFLGNPTLLAQRVHEHEPVYWNDKRRVWFVTGYPEIVAALKDRRFSIRYYERKIEQTQDLTEEALALRRQLYAGGLTNLNFGGGRSLLVMDAPEHTPYRMLLQPHFGERESERQRPIIEQIVSRLLDEWRDQDTVEVMSTLAYKLPVLLFGSILGIPEHLRAKFIDYDAFTESRATKSHLATLQDYRKAAAQGPAFAAKFGELVAEKRACPAHDILTTLTLGEVNGQPLPDAQRLAMIYLLYTGSHSTTTALIGNAVYYFLHFGLWSQLCTKPETLPQAIEEVLRFDPPTLYVGRELVEDAEFFGQHLRKGDTVLLYYVAANRDAREFPDPDTFNITRPRNRHLAFGLGTHFCLGSSFARLEALIALRQMMQRYPHLQLSGAPEHAHSFGFSQLSVRLC
jgi:hypothetical protein